MMKKDEVVPLLLIPGGADNLHSVTMTGWKSVEGGIELHIPTSFRKKRCCGSSHGWLIYAEEDLSLTLLNPFVPNSRIIRLPPVKQRNNPHQRPHFSYDIQKVILSADPDTDTNYEVLALHTLEGKLAYFKPNGGTHNWIYPHTEEGGSLRRFYRHSIFIQDIVHYRGKFYAVSHDRFIASLELIIISNNVVAAVVLSEYLKITSPRVDNYFKPYLVVSSSGSLLYVQRLYYVVGGYYVMDGSVYHSDNRQFTQSFRVYEIKDQNNNILLEPWSSSSSNSNSNSNNNQQQEEEAIFIGFNHAISAVGSSVSCNSPPAKFIYYTDDFWWGIPLDGVHDPPKSYYQPYGPIDIGFFRINNDDDDDDDDEEQPTRMKNYILEHSTSTKDPPPIWISFKLDYLST